MTSPSLSFQNLLYVHGLLHKEAAKYQLEVTEAFHTYYVQNGTSELPLSSSTSVNSILTPSVAKP